MSSPVFEVAKASTLNNKLRLEDVGLIALEAKLLQSASEPRLSFSMSLDGIEWILDDGHIHAVFPVGVTIESVVAKQRHPLAEIRVAFRASYGLDASFDRSDDLEASEHFLAIVGWLHVWPYVRAEVQQFSSRLGFPALVLPPLLAGQTANVKVRQTVQEAEPRKKASAKAKAALKEGAASKNPRASKPTKQRRRVD